MCTLTGQPEEIFTLCILNVVNIFHSRGVTSGECWLHARKPVSLWCIWATWRGLKAEWRSNFVRENSGHPSFKDVKTYAVSCVSESIHKYILYSHSASGTQKALSSPVTELGYPVLSCHTPAPLMLVWSGGWENKYTSLMAVSFRELRSSFREMGIALNTP